MSEPTAPASLSERSILQVGIVLLRHRRTLLIAPSVAAFALLAVAFALPRTYTATASFVPQSLTPSRLSAFANLSAQLGLGNIAQSVTFGSPDLYKELLETREILGEIAETAFDAPDAGKGFRGTLADYWQIRAATAERRRDRVIRRLRDQVLHINVAQRIQLVEVRATTRSAYLSKNIVERALELVNRFNQEKRQSQSGEERRFIGGRLQESKGELREAEDAVARFMEKNRDFRNSPALTFQYERLQREVALRQTLYATLSQSYEQSRIEEVRDTPVITVVERPELPPRPDSRQIVLKVALALLAGSLVGVLGAFGKEFFLRAPEQSLDVAEFEGLLAQFLWELRRPWRLIGVRPH